MPRHVAAVTVTLLSIEEFNYVVRSFFEFVPMNKIPWTEGLMTSATLARRTVIKLGPPGCPWDLDKGLAKEPLGAPLFHTIEVDVAVEGIAWDRPDRVAHSFAPGLMLPEGSCHMPFLGVFFMC